MTKWLKNYLRRPIGALFVAAHACGIVSVALRVVGQDERAVGAIIAMFAVLAVQHVYWVWIPELTAPRGDRGRPARQRRHCLWHEDCDEADAFAAHLFPLARSHHKQPGEPVEEYRKDDHQ